MSFCFDHCIHIHAYMAHSLVFFHCSKWWQKTKRLPCTCYATSWRGKRGAVVKAKSVINLLLMSLLRKCYMVCSAKENLCLNGMCKAKNFKGCTWLLDSVVLYTKKQVGFHDKRSARKWMILITAIEEAGASSFVKNSWHSRDHTTNKQMELLWGLLYPVVANILRDVRGTSLPDGWASTLNLETLLTLFVWWRRLTLEDSWTILMAFV